MQSIVDALQEVVKQDQLLAKQVLDMEEFEKQSKADRSKLLSGTKVHQKILI